MGWRGRSRSSLPPCVSRREHSEKNQPLRAGAAAEARRGGAGRRWAGVDLRRARRAHGRLRRGADGGRRAPRRPGGPAREQPRGDGGVAARDGHRGGDRRPGAPAADGAGGAGAHRRRGGRALARRRRGRRALTRWRNAPLARDASLRAERTPGDDLHLGHLRATEGRGAHPRGLRRQRRRERAQPRLGAPRPLGRRPADRPRGRALGAHAVPSGGAPGGASSALRRRRRARRGALGRDAGVGGPDDAEGAARGRPGQRAGASAGAAGGRRGVPAGAACRERGEGREGAGDLRHDRDVLPGGDAGADPRAGRPARRGESLARGRAAARRRRRGPRRDRSGGAHHGARPDADARVLGPRPARGGSVVRHGRPRVARRGRGAVDTRAAHRPGRDGWRERLPRGGRAVPGVAPLGGRGAGVRITRPGMGAARGGGGGGAGGGGRRGRVARGALATRDVQRLAGFKRPRLLARVDSIAALPSGKPDRAGAPARYGASVGPWGDGVSSRA